jgi:hypothetical protein
MVAPGAGVEERVLGPDVVVLGAGFSKAISTALPTTDELGEEVRERLTIADRARLSAAPFTNGRFEE